MSKGHGKIQRAVIAYLESQPREHRRWSVSSYVTLAYPHWHTMSDIAGTIFSPDDDWTRPSRAQIESVRRAVKNLGAEGLAEVGYKTWPVARNDPRVGRTEADIRQLSVRPVLTDDEQAAEDADRKAAYQRMGEILSQLR
jgi:hypothetical protein